MKTNSTLTKEEYAWAFGDDTVGMSFSGLPAKWNRIHSDLFKIELHDSVEVTEVKIKSEFAKVGI